MLCLFAQMALFCLLLWFVAYDNGLEYFWVADLKFMSYKLLKLDPPNPHFTKHSVKWITDYLVKVHHF